VVVLNQNGLLDLTEVAMLYRSWLKRKASFSYTEVQTILENHLNNSLVVGARPKEAKERKMKISSPTGDHNEFITIIWSSAGWE
jgi:hypothetical protein